MSQRCIFSVRKHVRTFPQGPIWAVIEHGCKCALVGSFNLLRMSQLLKQYITNEVLPQWCRHEFHPLFAAHRNRIPARQHHMHSWAGHVHPVTVHLVRVWYVLSKHCILLSSNKLNMSLSCDWLNGILGLFMYFYIIYSYLDLLLLFLYAMYVQF